MILELTLNAVIYSLIILGIGVVITAIYAQVYSRLLHKNKSELALLKSNAFKEAQSVLDDARKEALEIITTAQQEAHTILGSATSLNQSSQEEMDEKIRSLNEAYLAQLTKLSNTLSDKFSKTLSSEGSVLQNSASKFEGVVAEELKAMRSELHTQLDNSQHALLSQTSNLYKQVQTELDEYKKHRMAMVDAQALELVTAAAKDLFRLTLTPKQHEQIILEKLHDRD